MTGLAAEATQVEDGTGFSCFGLLSVALARSAGDELVVVCGRCHELRIHDENKPWRTLFFPSHARKLFPQSVTLADELVGKVS